MQLAGNKCAFCKRNIMFEADGTWCSACKTLFHRQCLAQADTICPICARPSDPPEGHFVFSQFCPECLKRNDPPREHCTACHERTRWDTRADYEIFSVEMKYSARIRLVRALAELGGGALCLFALISQFVFLRTTFGGTGASVLGFMFLTTDGLVSLMKSRKIRQFR
jgi:hypothetical protein